MDCGGAKLKGRPGSPHPSYATACYHVHAYAHLSAALLCCLDETGAETSILLTALNNPHPIHAAHS